MTDTGTGIAAMEPEGPVSLKRRRLSADDLNKDGHGPEKTRRTVSRVRFDKSSLELRKTRIQSIDFAGPDSPATIAPSEPGTPPAETESTETLNFSYSPRDDRALASPEEDLRPSSDSDPLLPLTRPRDVERDTGRRSPIPRDDRTLVDYDSSSRKRHRTPSPPRTPPRDRSPSPSPVHPTRDRSPTPEPYSPAPYNEEEWQQPSSLNPAVLRTLTLKYWERTEECTYRKKAHLARIDAEQTSREDWIMKTTLAVDDTVLEPNPFPYATPRGIEHWTLWSIHALKEAEVEAFVFQWIKDNQKSVVRWNFDWNEGNGSIEIWHIHVYFQVVEDEQVDWDVGKIIREEEEKARRRWDEEQEWREEGQYERKPERKRRRWDSEQDEYEYYPEDRRVDDKDLETNQH